MNCPVCSVELKIYVRQGIEVDYCPQCRGVWLDRGELDKIIEAAQAEQQPAAARVRRDDDDDDKHRKYGGHSVGQHHPSQHRGYDDRSGYRRDHDDDNDRWKYNSKHRKKRGMLGEIFDIFD